MYWCPAGEILKNTGGRSKLLLTRYVADPEICNSCPLKSKCTNGKSRRAVNRNFDEEYFEKVKGYYELEAYKKAMRKRKVGIEPLFGEAKQWHDMERMRLRMLEIVNCEALITASGQNIKRLLTFGSRGPRRRRGWRLCGFRSDHRSASIIAGRCTLPFARTLPTAFLNTLREFCTLRE